MAPNKDDVPTFEALSADEQGRNRTIVDRTSYESVDYLLKGGQVPASKRRN